MARPSATRLPVAAGEPADPAIQEMVDAEQFCGFLDASPDLGALVVLTFQGKADVLPHIHVRVERKKLEHKGDIPC